MPERRSTRMRAPGLAGWIRPLRTGLVARPTRAARALAPPDAPRVVPAPAGVATGADPPEGVVAGVAGVGGASGARDAFVLTLVKNAHVSIRPKRDRSCGPVTGVVPFVPTICARTIRGDVPRCRTSMRRKRPRTRPCSLALTWDIVSVAGFQRWRGERSSYGSSTPLSQGFGAEPTNEFSTLSVCPPEVEKK